MEWIDLRLSVMIIFLCISLILTAYEYSRIKKKYEELEKTHEQLKTEVRLLQQENYYLKMMTGADRV